MVVTLSRNDDVAGLLCAKRGFHRFFCAPVKRDALLPNSHTCCTRIADVMLAGIAFVTLPLAQGIHYDDKLAMRAGIGVGLEMPEARRSVIYFKITGPARTIAVVQDQHTASIGAWADCR